MTKILNPSHLEKRLSNSIYVALVASLYSENAMMVLGTVSTALAMLLSAYSSDSAPLYLVAAAQCVIGGVRAAVGFLQTRDPSDNWTRRKAAKWDKYYTLGAVAHTIVMGAWCYIAFVFTDDAFAQFANAIKTNLAPLLV